MGRQGDAADDPAIWVNPNDAAASRVLGTNKKQGLLVTGLDGQLLQELPVGRLNNVDVRPGFARQASGSTSPWPATATATASACSPSTAPRAR